MKIRQKRFPGLFKTAFPKLKLLTEVRENCVLFLQLVKVPYYVSALKV
jgi:hypothetical protein